MIGVLWLAKEKLRAIKTQDETLTAWLSVGHPFSIVKYIVQALSCTESLNPFFTLTFIARDMHSPFNMLSVKALGLAGLWFNGQYLLPLPRP